MKTSLLEFLTVQKNHVARIWTISKSNFEMSVNSAKLVVTRLQYETIVAPFYFNVQAEFKLSQLCAHDF